MGVEALALAIRVGSSWLAAVQTLAEMKPLSHPTVIVLVCILWPTASHLRLVVLRADINIVSTCQFRAAKCVDNMVGAMAHGPWQRGGACIADVAFALTFQFRSTVL